MARADKVGEGFGGGGRGMTASVIKKVSPNVKVIKPGSRPLTQSATEKRAMIEKAQTKTPAARQKAASAKKNAKASAAREERFNRNIYLNDVYRNALEDAGYKSLSNIKPTPAQVKSANKAVNNAQAKLAARKKMK